MKGLQSDFICDATIGKCVINSNYLLPDRWKVGLSSSLALEKASSHQGYQSTGKGAGQRTPFHKAAELLYTVPGVLD